MALVLIWEKLLSPNQFFKIRMTVSDPVIVTVLDQLLQEVAGRQVEAFEKRCDELPVPVDLIRTAELLKQQQQQ